MEHARATSPTSARVVLWVWMVAVCLSLYGADDIRGWLRMSGVWTSPVRPAAAPSPPPTPPSAPAPPQARSPAPVRRLLLVGASSIQFNLGAELERALVARAPGLTVKRVGKLSTGLTRPDVHDWPAHLRALVADFRPDLVVANFGGNDAQGLVLAGGEVVRFGQPAWDATYRQRVGEAARIAAASGARVVFLGMSTTRDAALSRRMERINRLTEEAAGDAGAIFVSAWDLGADARGQFQDVMTIDGVPVRTRLADGKHFSRAGAAAVARVLVERLAARCDLARGAVPAAPARAAGEVAEPHRVR